jgi:hypothetical protein
MKNIIGVIAISVLGMQSVLAQNEFDALRYSQIDVLGTARYSGMGGAFGALGGDMSSLSVNPAGIAVFTRTTASASISVLSASTDASYLGMSSSDNKLNMNISNAGFVARFKRKKAADKQWAWKAFHLGVSYNRTANFHRRTSIIGVSTNSSIVDGWVGQLNATGTEYADIPSEFIPGAEFTNAHLGWGTFLIDTMPGSTNSYIRNVAPNYGQTQQVREMTKGAMGEVALSFGGNFGNALYIGATVGIPRINYELERAYTESDSQDTIADFSSFTKTDYLKATGTGFNFKFGLLYRPVKWLRVGAAIHTPTFFEIDESYTSVLTSNLNNTQYSLSTMQGKFDYSLTTPFRAIGSLGFVIGKIGLVSADYEYVNYSMAKFRSRNYGFDTENTNVKNNLHWAGNIRMGTEWRIKPVSIRAGFAINGDAFTGAYNFNNTRYSLGLGLRLKRFFTDLTYNLHRSVNNYEVYADDNVPLADALTLDHSVIFTVGFRF